jgi:hypothetical protein
MTDAPRLRGACCRRRICVCGCRAEEAASAGARRAFSRGRPTLTKPPPGRPGIYEGSDPTETAWRAVG